MAEIAAMLSRQRSKIIPFQIQRLKSTLKANNAQRRTNGKPAATAVFFIIILKTRADVYPRKMLLIVMFFPFSPVFSVFSISLSMAKAIGKREFMLTTLLKPFIIFISLQSFRAAFIPLLQEIWVHI